MKTNYSTSISVYTSPPWEGSPVLVEGVADAENTGEWVGSLEANTYYYIRVAAASGTTSYSFELSILSINISILSF